MISYLPRIVIICVIHFNLSIAIVLAADDQTADNIRKKVEVIQSTQTLQIGDARITSITVLPELYENNGYQPLWTNPAIIDDRFLWTSRVQVGRPYRRTPVFKGEITYLELNPPGRFRRASWPEISFRRLKKIPII